MKIRVCMIFAVFLAAVLLTACGEDPELTRFRKSMDDFCTRISEIDTAINDIDAESDDAASELLTCLDDLDLVFQSFSELDFPEDFDYLEDLADESSEYMTEATMRHSAAIPITSRLRNMPAKITPEPTKGFRSSSPFCMGKNRLTLTLPSNMKINSPSFPLENIEKSCHGIRLLPVAALFHALISTA